MASKMQNFWQQQLREQIEWINTCGGSLAGYIAKYGDPGQPNAEGHVCGDGGTAIYKADQNALERIRSRIR